MITIMNHIKHYTSLYFESIMASSKKDFYVLAETSLAEKSLNKEEVEKKITCSTLPRINRNKGKRQYPLPLITSPTDAET